MALDVSALSDFNNETAGKMIPKIVYTGNTAEYTSVQEGIKYLEPLNLFEVDLYVQEGYGCATTASGSAVFTQRNLQVCGRQSFDSLCLKDLDKKYLGITSLDAGSYNTTWKLAETYSELIVNQMKKLNDTFLWNASTASGDCANGLDIILSSGSVGSGITDAAQVVGTAVPSLANMDLMIAALPDAVADRDDLTFFMSVGKFRTFVANIRSANSYYFDPNSIANRGGVLDMVYPYQNVRVVGTQGLSGSDRIVLGPAKQIVVGTDLVSDVDGFALWYDINTDSLRHRLSMKLGVQVAYPEFWITNNL